MSAADPHTDDLAALSGIPIYESRVVPDGQMFRTPMGLHASAATIAALQSALAPPADEPWSQPVRFWIVVAAVLVLMVALAVMAVTLGGA